MSGHCCNVQSKHLAKLLNNHCLNPLMSGHCCNEETKAEVKEPSSTSQSPYVGSLL